VVSEEEALDALDSDEPLEFGPNSLTVTDFLNRLWLITPDQISRLVTTWRDADRDQLHESHANLQALVETDEVYREFPSRSLPADIHGILMRVASIASDILFGTPSPVRSRANLGVLGAKTVNVLVHGHEPALSEMLAVATRDPEIVAETKAVGAEGLTLAGICCTANEILIRHGIPVAGNFLQQELAIVTGAVEMLITDVQCCMPSLPEVAQAYHTEVVSTSEIAKTIGSTSLPFDEAHALDSAKALLRRAIANFKNRNPSKVAIPTASQPLVAGFSVAAIKYMLGGTYRASFRPLNDAIIQGRIKGIVGIVDLQTPLGVAPGDHLLGALGLGLPHVQRQTSHRRQQLQRGQCVLHALALE